MKRTLFNGSLSALSLVFVAVFALLLCYGSSATSAPAPYSHYFGSRCSSCHLDDSVTCDGCHRHGNRYLSATADKSSYAPGEEVVITLNGGDMYGWIRGSLNRTDGTEVDRKTGPTFSGNDGGTQIEYPVTLKGRAPGKTGSFAWAANYFGSNNSGTSHSSAAKTVMINVASTSDLVVDVVPQFSPMTFGSSGGTVYCDIDLENTTTSSVGFDTIVMVRMPAGNLVGPVLGPVHAAFPGSYSTTVPFSVILPAAAPAGIYSLIVFVGDITNSVRYDSDSFAFAKEQ
jgi:hypothetical protein